MRSIESLFLGFIAVVLNRGAHENSGVPPISEFFVCFSCKFLPGVSINVSFAKE
jgi:hypothetical protein